ncbi:MAG TPA: hydrogenase maturation nickel metallochaperone HypA [Candidatus Avacidaminococcus intestinavium]|uniref:Hydrogenase maturation factor HypA n=1 Tax=Candidatus Avacidaminococcus intestinavium TaxID=2840684 RepID=A0A9D1MR99_9FIRM|nr:hydrogenase maturation nickel metallochaperone HypA [Candidatus Avacidaminococcus intestinavium]
MHEYPITVRIIKIAEDHARKHDATAVKKINLVVGDYSGYVASSIELYFEIIAADTLCATAKLDITRIRPELQCTNCNKNFLREPFSFTCPLCGGEGRPTKIGREFYIKSIEIEQNEGEA